MAALARYAMPGASLSLSSSVAQFQKRLPSPQASSHLFSAPRSHFQLNARGIVGFLPLTARLNSGLGIFHGKTLQENQNLNNDRSIQKGIRAAAPAANEGMRSLGIAVGIPLVLGVVDALVNGPGTKWYFDLKKPRWQPPSFLFGGAWSVLYPLMGLASWLVWAEGGWAKQSHPLTIYGVQLVLNLAWPALFFGAKNLQLAFVDIVALCGAIIVTIAAFKPVNEVAANLLKPYLAWVLFATVLNYKLWDLNKDGEPSSSPSASA